MEDPAVIEKSRTAMKCCFFGLIYDWVFMSKIG
jgi:hypothetical protein